MRTKRDFQILLVLLLFCTVGVLRHLHQFGEDLGSSYLACRLLAAGEGDHLYIHNPLNFAQVNDPVWTEVARQTGFAPLNMIHPYVQTPLWAWSLEPLCTHMRYRTFCNLYIVVFMLCASGMIWLVARYWTPALYRPLAIGLVFLVLYRSEPFKYAIFLAQTHILYIAMTVLALILAERRKGVPAGILLAMAAAIKLTPGLLVIYWLLTRRHRATISFIVSFVALTALAPVLLGSGLMREYLRSLAYNSNVLLLAFNNQSFAAWWVSLRASRLEALHWYSYQLPAGLKWVSDGLSLTAAIAGGLMDRRIRERYPSPDAAPPPVGAAFTLMAATVFAPIAWIHYYIVLLIPAMFFLQEARVRRQWIWIACTVLILVLNYYPVSIGAVHVAYRGCTLLRSQFYSGLLAMAGLLDLGYQQWKHPQPARAYALA